MSPVDRLKGKVIVINKGDDETRVWRMGNTWGDSTLHFAMIHEGHTYQLNRKPQIYTRNVPSSERVPPGGQYEIAFDLQDGSWEPPVVVGQLAAGDVSVQALYHVSKSSEASEQGVWVGELSSQVVRLK
jgi:hypothetical protein